MKILNLKISCGNPLALAAKKNTQVVLENAAYNLKTNAGRSSSSNLWQLLTALNKILFTPNNAIKNNGAANHKIAMQYATVCLQKK